MNYEALLSVQHSQTTFFAARHDDLVVAGNSDPPQFGELDKMQKVQAHDEDTLGSSSGASDISALENETDTFGKEILQHERDARRIRNALNADQRPLLRSRARPRISELVERREREEMFTSNRHQERVESFGNNGSEPPLNVPREWGTRAKSHRGWMRRIREPSEAEIPPQDEDFNNVDQDLGGDARASHRAAYPGDDYWSSPSNDASPTIEGTPPSMNRPRTSSQPDSLRHMNSTLRHIIDSEEPDFSELSLLASTPAVARTTKTVQREIQHNDRQSIPDRRLDQRSIVSPNSSLRRRRSREAAATAASSAENAPRADAYEPRPVTAPPASTRPRVSHRRSLIGNKENLPVNSTIGTNYKGSETVTITDRTAQAVTFKQPQRPGHSRNDSLKLLQRLARVSSMSPSPGKPSPEKVPGRSGEAPRRKQSGGLQGGAILNARASSRDTVAGDIPAVSRRSRSRSATYDVQENAKLIVEPAPQERNADAPGKTLDVDTTPALQNQRNSVKTPVVTGAWVNTPGPPTEVRPSLQISDSTTRRSFSTSSGEATLESPNLQDDQALESEGMRNGSNRPRSALEDIVLEARNNPGGPFGDATIQSLEDIAHPNLDATDPTLTFETIEAAADDSTEANDSGRPLTQAEKDRRQEDLAMEAMNKHLRAARTSIQDADRGLRRVENRVDITHTEQQEPTPVPHPVKKAVDIGSTWRTECDHCGGSYRSVWQGLWVELRSNFYDYDRSTRFGVRLTWLGLLVLIWLVWHLAENTLCSYYCHPMYAEKMIGYGVNPDAPRYPFVLPTLAFRPLRPVWRPIVDWLELLFTAVFNLVYGEPKQRPEPLFMQPDFKITHDMINWEAWPNANGRNTRKAWNAKWTGSIISATAAATARATRSFVDAVDQIGLMEDDEYLS